MKFILKFRLSRKKQTRHYETQQINTNKSYPPLNKAVFIALPVTFIQPNVRRDGVLYSGTILATKRNSNFFLFFTILILYYHYTVFKLKYLRTCFFLNVGEDISRLTTPFDLIFSGYVLCKDNHKMP